MTHQFIIERDYSDSEIRDFFIADVSKPVPNMKKEIETQFGKSDVVCIQIKKIDNFIIDCVRRSDARIYILISNIEENELKPISGKAIIREVSDLHQNMIICDGLRTIIFNEDYEGFKTEKNSAYLQHLFNRWFWQKSNFEYINKKEPVKDTTFDDEIITSNEDIILGSNVSTLISNSEKIISTGQYSNRFSSKIQIVGKPLSKEPQSNNTQLSYAPDVPLSFCVSNGKMFYVNIKPSEYFTCPEKDTDAVYAIAEDFDGYGKTYRYVKKCIRKSLVGKELKKIDGTDFVINEHNEKTTNPIEMDLQDYRFYESLEISDIEARLSKQYPELFSDDSNSVFVTFTIPVKISKHKSPEKISLYNEYAKLSTMMVKKINEIENNIQPPIDCTDLLKIKEKKYTTASDYNNDIKLINSKIKIYNKSISKGTDNALDEVLEAKSKNKIKKYPIDLLKPVDLRALPSFGTMYVTRGGFEYVIKNESYLDDAKRECDDQKMSNVTYHLE